MVRSRKLEVGSRESEVGSGEFEVKILDIGITTAFERLSSFKFHKERIAREMIFAFEQILKENNVKNNR